MGFILKFIIIINIEHSYRVCMLILGPIDPHYKVYQLIINDKSKDSHATNIAVRHSPQGRMCGSTHTYVSGEESHHNSWEVIQICVHKGHETILCCVVVDT